MAKRSRARAPRVWGPSEQGTGAMDFAKHRYNMVESQVRTNRVVD
ncbi:MAG: hypothetical protein AAB543_01835 [Pseudomonadota bacterium]